MPINKKMIYKYIHKIINKLFGNEVGSRIGLPFLESNFGEYAKLISYSCLKTIIKDRSLELGYISKGFEVIYNHLSNEIS